MILMNDSPQPLSSWFATQEEKHQYQLALLATFGSRAAAATATIYYCFKEKISLPADFVQLHGLEAINAITSAAGTRLKGRTGHPIISGREAFKKFIRWQYVVLTRDTQRLFYSGVLERAKEERRPTAYYYPNESFPHGFGRTWPQAFAKASSALQGTPAFGSAEMIKASFIEVSKGRRVGDYLFEGIDVDVRKFFGVGPERFF